MVIDYMKLSDYPLNVMMCSVGEILSDILHVFGDKCT